MTRTEDRKVGLGIGQALLGRCPVPFERLLLVFGDTLTMGIHHRQVRLCMGHTLLRGQCVALHGLSKVLLHTLAVGVHQAQIVERGELEIQGLVFHGLGHAAVKTSDRENSLHEASWALRNKSGCYDAAKFDRL